MGLCLELDAGLKGELCSPLTLLYEGLNLVGDFKLKEREFGK